MAVPRVAVGPLLWCWLFGGAVLTSFGPSVVAASVQRLGDATFEHETQATTGGTTGSWLVTFGAEGCARCAKLRKELQSVSEDLREIYTIPAHVDQADAAGLWKRFGLKEVPVTYFFSKGGMYRFDGKEEGRELLKFATEALDGAMEVRREKIPPEPNFLSELIDLVLGSIVSLVKGVNVLAMGAGKQTHALVNTLFGGERTEL
mmetsp:Transcript_148720/g.477594  ORF Transcript_148720/g.477594 Transcript_148720/m.477594 type:complete len:204 (+) Transcript_148720:60-671(+)